MRLNGLILTGILLSAIFAGCDNGIQHANLIVRMTDSPGDYDSVLIDLQNIEVHRSPGNQTTGWISLSNVNSGVYDLVSLSNAEVVLSDASFPAGQISQMRFVLGSENFVVIGGQKIKLATPSSQQSGLKFLINTVLLEGITYSFLVDFDAARSVVSTGGGNYNLKPVLRVITEATSGAIKGIVEPASETVAVYAIQGADTLGTSYAAQDISEFLIGGLQPGSYTIVLDPGQNSSLNPKTLENIMVNLGEVSDTGTTTLQ